MRTNLKNMGILTIAVGLWFITACNNEPARKVIKQEVLDLHDTLMVKGEAAITDKMILENHLDSGIQKSVSGKSREELVTIIADLEMADSTMMAWMQTFEPEKQRTAAVAAAYFMDQKIRLTKMDSLYNGALKASGIYIKEHELGSNPKKQTAHH